MKRRKVLNLILLGDPASGKATQAARLVRREINAVTKAAQRHPDERDAFVDAVEEFYDGFVALLREQLYLADPDARAYCNRHLGEIEGQGLLAMHDWAESAGALAWLALAAEEKRGEPAIA